MSESIGLLSLTRSSSVGSSPFGGARAANTSHSGGGDRLSGFSSLPTTILRRIFQLCDVSTVSRSCGVCTSFALVCRSDEVWQVTLTDHWFERRHRSPKGEFELEHRFHQARQQRRVALGEISPQHLPNREGNQADTPTRIPVTPILAAQRLRESGIPRSRSSAQLVGGGGTSNTNPNPLSSSSSSSSSLRPSGSPRSSDPSSSPLPTPNSLPATLNLTSLLESEDRNQQSSASASAQMQQSAPAASNIFTFPHIDEEEEKDQTPTGSAHTTNPTHKRWCAHAGSLKAIYQDTLLSSHKRFDYLEQMAAAAEYPEFIRWVSLAAVFVAVFSWFLLWIVSPFLLAPGVGGGSGSSSLFGFGIPLFDTNLLRIFLHPALLSFLYTTSCLVCLVFVGYNSARVLILSVITKTALWKNSPGRDPTRPESIFQREDKAWWRMHHTNRWYLVRYQVWHPPIGSVLLLFLIGCGLFVLLWGGLSSLFASLPFIGLTAAVLVPGIVVIIIFQIGRMVFLSRFTHVFLTSILSCVQLATLVWLLSSTKNPLLVALVDRSLFGAGIYLTVSFAPNFLLLFGELWITDEYLVLGWTPVILPPLYLDLGEGRLGPTPGSGAGGRNDQVQTDEGGNRASDGSASISSSSRSYIPSDLELGLATASPRAMHVGQEGGVHGWAVLPSENGVGTAPSPPASTEAAASSASTPATTEAHDPASCIPPAHSFGHLLLGSNSKLERWLRRHPSAARIISSRPGLSFLGGLSIYLAGLTYWSILLDTFLDGSSSLAASTSITNTMHGSFIGLSWLWKLFHIVTIIQMIVIASGICLMVALITLQNRNWQWWWLSVYTSLVYLACLCLHFTLWRHSLTTSLTHLHEWSVQGDPGSYATLSGFQTHLSQHWCYSWTTWLYGLTSIIGVTMCVNIFVLALLYRPKNVEKGDAYLSVHTSFRAARLRVLPNLPEESDEEFGFDGMLLYDTEEGTSRTGSFVSLQAMEVAAAAPINTNTNTTTTHA